MLVVVFGQQRGIYYSSFKLEFLGLKWAMTEKFRSYLMGSKFIVYTDNNPLSYLDTAKLGATEQRWALQLAAFDFKIIYRPGKKNANVDALSRKVNELDNSELIAPTFSGSIPVQLRNIIGSVGDTGDRRYRLSSTLSFPAYTKADLKEMQRKDPNIQCFREYLTSGRKPSSQERKKLSKSVLALLRQREKIKEEDGVLYRTIHYPGEGAVRQLLLPCSLKSNVISCLHDDLGHQGVERTHQLIRKRCFWPGMCSDVTIWIKKCQRCTLGQMPHPKVKSRMGSTIA